MFDSPLDKLKNWLKDILGLDEKIGYLKTPNEQQILEIRDDKEITNKDPEDLPEQVRDDFDITLDDLLKDRVQEARYETYEHKPANQIIHRAIDNDYVLSDIVNDPSIIDCDTSTEAVEAIAEAEPGWAKMVDVTEIDSNADPDIDSEADSSATNSGDGDSGETSANASSSIEVSEAEVGNQSASDMSGIGSGSIDTGSGDVDIDTGSAGNSAGSGNSSGGGAGTGGGSGSGGN